MVKKDGVWRLIESAEVSRARAALAEESRFTSALLDATSAFVVTMGADGRIIRCNEAFASALGRHRAELEGRCAWEAVDLPRERILEIVGQCWEAGGNYFFEARLPLPKGDLTVAWSTAGVHNDAGDLVYVVATGQDITEHREAETRLRQAYELEHRVATKLQESLLRPVPQIDGLDVHVAYKPAIEAEHVGGDFYDLFEIDEDLVGVTIGDVAGKGVEAAVLTSLVNNTVRAHAIENVKTPGQILRMANEILFQSTPPDSFVTAMFGILDLETGRMVYSNAGHTTAALVRRGGAIVQLPPTGPILGAFRQMTFEQAEVNLAIGDTLFLYPDGLTEARSDGQFYGEDRLFETLASISPSRSDLVSGVIHDVMSFADNVLLDDLAVLSVRRVDTAFQSLVS